MPWILTHSGKTAVCNTSTATPELSQNRQKCRVTRPRRKVIEETPNRARNRFLPF